MPKYLALLNWTDKGMAADKDTVGRAETCRAGMKAMGLKMGEVYWSLGLYDVVLTFDAPDNEAAARVRLANMSLDNAHWTVLPLFGEKEMQRIVQGMPPANPEAPARRTRK